jgi:hypothetical protein
LTLAVHRERVRLTAGAVEREHQLCAPALPERVLTDETLKLGNKLRVETELEVGIDPAIERRQTQLFKPAALGARERFVEVCQNGPAPEPEGLLQRLGCRGRFLSGRFFDQPLEALRIEVAGVDLDQVAGRPRDDRLAAEGLAKLRDVYLERRRGGLGRGPAPKLVDQTAAGNDLVRVQQENSEQLARFRACDGNLPAAHAHLERTEDQELHCLRRPPLRPPWVRANALLAAPSLMCKDRTGRSPMKEAPKRSPGRCCAWKT